MSEKLKSLQVDGKNLVFTKKSMYEFIKSFYSMIAFPDIECLDFIEGDPLGIAETLGYSHFNLVGCGFDFIIGLSKEKKCIVTGMFKPYSGVSSQLLDPEHFDFTEIYGFFEEEQTDNGQSKEQTDNGQAEEQTDNGQSEEQADKYICSLNGVMVSTDEIDNIVRRISALKILLEKRLIDRKAFYDMFDVFVSSYGLPF